METLAVAVRADIKSKIREPYTIADSALLPLLECHVYGYISTDGYITSDIKHLMHNACTSHI